MLTTMPAHPAPAHRFYLVLAGAFAAVAVAGFTPGYWLKVASGTYTRAPIFHIHGVLLFGWICLYLAQTALVASGRTLRHRAWGMAGIAWFSITICSTVALMIRAMQVAESQGGGEMVRPIVLVSFISIALAIGLFAASIATVRQPETHKRLMVLVMVVLIQAAVARLVVAPFSPPGPPSLQSTMATALASDAFVVAAMLYDWRTRGRPHNVYIWGGLLLLVTQLLIAPLFASSTAGAAFARSIEGIMG
jgi:hypothetical protein